MPDNLTSTKVVFVKTKFKRKDFIWLRNLKKRADRSNVDPQFKIFLL